ncbi:MAG: phytanoyl-CoA dioxygenase family protein [Planctomycetota bacterium]|nr:phytanoyl-CoA dioxygenase family protein [Planctomycetota bacterium]
MRHQPLTDAQRRCFNEEGYLIVRNALDPETVARLVEAGDRLVASARLKDRQRSKCGHFDGFRNAIAMDDAFLPLLTQPTTVPLVVQLFGPNLQLMTSHLIYRHPDPSDAPPTHRHPGWHRDIAGTPEDLGHPHIPRMEVKVAYYLTDLSEPGCGATLVAPGSHKLKERLVISDGQVDPVGALEPSLRPGDALFFENRTWHAGGANRCGRTRKAVMFGYGYRWLRPMDYLVQDSDLLEKIADPIGRQLLGATGDPEGRFVAGGGAEPLRDWCREHAVAWRPVA